MKQTQLLLLLIFTCPWAVWSQITITQESWPSIGDTLFTAVDNLPPDFLMDVGEGKQSWDFTSLQAPFAIGSRFRNAGTGEASSSFRTSRIVMDIGTDLEGYYRKKDNQLLLQGFYGADPLGIGIKTMGRYLPALIERRSPMNYLDVHDTQSNLLLLFSADDLPNSLLQKLPITPDSVRIKIEIDRQDVVDSWGTLTIPGGIYDVLREKRIETKHATLEVKLNYVGWQDVTEEVMSNVDFLGVKTNVHYYYFSDTVMEPVAIVTVDDNNNVTKVAYKANETQKNVQSIRNLKPGVYAFPNPAIVNVRFEFSNLPPGKYDLKIHNILGVEEWTKEYVITQKNHIEKVDISSLKKGTYLYTLSDSTGKVITTRRLIVVRP